MEKFNITLVKKWVWRALNDHNSLWSRVLIAKYEKEEEWLKKKNNRKGSIWWRDMRKIYQLHVNRGLMSKKLRRKLGDRRYMKFWKSKWLGDEPAKKSYKRLFLNSTQQE